MMRAGIGLVAAGLVAHAVVVHAAPLDKEECAKLKGEQAQLEQGGVRASMGRGPEWAKANLAPEKLEQVRRIIELDEQLLFRCQGKPLVSFREAPDPDPAATGSKDAAKATAAKAAKKPVKKAALPAGGAVKDAPKAPPAAKKAAPLTPGAATGAAPPKAPAPIAGEAGAKKGEPAKEAKAKAKRKTPDANSADWTTNPFADMLAPAKK